MGIQKESLLFYYACRQNDFTFLGVQRDSTVIEMCFCAVHESRMPMLSRVSCQWSILEEGEMFIALASDAVQIMSACNRKEDVAKLRPHDLSLLDAALDKVEKTLKVPRSTLFQYIAKIYPHYSTSPLTHQSALLQANPGRAEAHGFTHLQPTQLSNTRALSTYSQNIARYEMQNGVHSLNINAPSTGERVEDHKASLLQSQKTQYNIVHPRHLPLNPIPYNPAVAHSTVEHQSFPQQVEQQRFSPKRIQPTPQSQRLPRIPSFVHAMTPRQHPFPQQVQQPFAIRPESISIPQNVSQPNKNKDISLQFQLQLPRRKGSTQEKQLADAMYGQQRDTFSCREELPGTLEEAQKTVSSHSTPQTVVSLAQQSSGGKVRKMSSYDRSQDQHCIHPHIQHEKQMLQQNIALQQQKQPTHQQQQLQQYIQPQRQQIVSQKSLVDQVHVDQPQQVGVQQQQAQHLQVTQQRHSIQQQQQQLDAQQVAQQQQQIAQQQHQQKIAQQQQHQQQQFVQQQHQQKIAQHQQQQIAQQQQQIAQQQQQHQQQQIAQQQQQHQQQQIAQQQQHQQQQIAQQQQHQQQQIAQQHQQQQIAQQQQQQQQIAQQQQHQQQQIAQQQQHQQQQIAQQQQQQHQQQQIAQQQQQHQQQQIAQQQQQHQQQQIAQQQQQHCLVHHQQRLIQQQQQQKKLVQHHLQQYGGQNQFMQQNQLAATEQQLMGHQHVVGRNRQGPQQEMQYQPHVGQARHIATQNQGVSPSSVAQSLQHHIGLHQHLSPRSQQHIGLPEKISPRSQQQTGLRKQRSPRSQQQISPIARQQISLIARQQISPIARQQISPMPQQQISPISQQHFGLHQQHQKTVTQQQLTHQQQVVHPPQTVAQQHMTQPQQITQHHIIQQQQQKIIQQQHKQNVQELQQQITHHEQQQQHQIVQEMQQQQFQQQMNSHLQQQQISSHLQQQQVNSHLQQQQAEKEPHRTPQQEQRQQGISQQQQQQHQQQSVQSQKHQPLQRVQTHQLQHILQQQQMQMTLPEQEKMPQQINHLFDKEEHQKKSVQQPIRYDEQHAKMYQNPAFTVRPAVTQPQQAVARQDQHKTGGQEYVAQERQDPAPLQHKQFADQRQQVNQPEQHSQSFGVRLTHIRDTTKMWLDSLVPQQASICQQPTEHSPQYPTSCVVEKAIPQIPRDYRHAQTDESQLCDLSKNVLTGQCQGRSDDSIPRSSIHKADTLDADVKDFSLRSEAVTVAEISNLTSSVGLSVGNAKYALPQDNNGGATCVSSQTMHRTAESTLSSADQRPPVYYELSREESNTPRESLDATKLTSPAGVQRLSTLDWSHVAEQSMDSPNSKEGCTAQNANQEVSPTPTVSSQTPTQKMGSLNTPHIRIHHGTTFPNSSHFNVRLPDTSAPNLPIRSPRTTVAFTLKRGAVDMNNQPNTVSGGISHLPHLPSVLEGRESTRHSSSGQEQVATRSWSEMTENMEPQLRPLTNSMYLPRTASHTTVSTDGEMSVPRVMSVEGSSATLPCPPFFSKSVTSVALKKAIGFLPTKASVNPHFSPYASKVATIETPGVSQAKTLRPHPNCVQSTIPCNQKMANGSCTTSPAVEQTIQLIVRRISTLQTQRSLLDFANIEDCARILFMFLKAWVAQLWSAAISVSYKRVDCPPQTLEPFVKDDLEFIARIENLKEQHDNEMKKFQRSSTTERVPVSSGGAVYDNSVARNRSKGDPKLKRTLGLVQTTENEDFSAKEQSAHASLQSLAADSTHNKSSLDALKDLGLQSSLFEGTEADSEKENENSSDIISQDKKRLEAELRAKEVNTVRRKQGKLTREVSVEDIIVVLKSEKFPSPLSFKKEAVRFFRMAYNAVPVSQPLTSNPVPELMERVFISWKSFGATRYSAKLGLFPERASKPQRFGSSGSSSQMLPKRFVNLWPDYVLNNKNCQKNRNRLLNSMGALEGDDASQTMDDKVPSVRGKRKRPGIPRRMSCTKAVSSNFSDTPGNPYLPVRKNNCTGLLAVDPASTLQNTTTLADDMLQHSMATSFPSFLDASIKDAQRRNDTPPLPNGLGLFQNSGMSFPSVATNSLPFFQKARRPLMYFSRGPTATPNFIPNPHLQNIPLQYPGYFDNAFIPRGF